MARPSCPLCQDNLSVVPVRAIYHYQASDADVRGDSSLNPSLFVPPTCIPLPGRYAAAATLAGICLWVVSGAQIVCLAMSLCIGMFIEFFAYLDSMDARAERQDALRRWRVAHYCGAHDAVFVPGESGALRPPAFARLMRPATTPNPTPAAMPAEAPAVSATAS